MSITGNAGIGGWGFKIGGYAIPLEKTGYKLKTQGVTLSSTSDQVLQMMQPGGLIIGIRFMFGI